MICPRPLLARETAVVQARDGENLSKSAEARARGKGFALSRTAYVCTDAGCRTVK